MSDISHNGDLKKKLIDIRDNCESDIFKKTDYLRSTLKDYHVEDREIILICTILKEYTTDFSRVLVNYSNDSIQRLSKKIAYDHFIDDTIVRSRLTLLIEVINHIDTESLINDIEYNTSTTNNSGINHRNNNTTSNASTKPLVGPNVINGVCGPNLKWYMDESTGKMLIKGSGPMSKIEYHSKWFDYKNMIRTLIVENGVTSISNNAFCGCDELETISLPNSLITIGGNAFSDCTSLKSVTIPNGVITIDSDAFSGCISLSDVHIPDTVRTIGMFAFRDCISLRKVSIPPNVDSWGVETAFPEWCAVTKRQ